MQFSNNLMSELPILALVFVSVLLVGVVLFPALFRPGKAPRRSVTDMRSLEDPLRRFIAPEELQRMRYSFALVVGLAGVAVVVLTSFLWGFPLVVLVMVMAYFLPKFYYDRKVQRRNQEFENGMLDFTVLVANTLRAGVALPAAIEMVLQNTHGALREEFGLTLQEHRLGVDLVESLERMNKRIKSENLQLFTVTVSVATRTGGSMADVLASVIQVIRSRAAFYERLQVMLTQANFEALCIALAPPVVFLLVSMFQGEMMLPLVTTKAGWAVIGVVAVLEFVGYLVIKKVTEVKY